MSREIPTDPAYLDRLPATVAEPGEDRLMSRMVDALRALCPNRIRTVSEMRQYNAVWARVDGEPYSKIGATLGITRQGAQKRIRKAYEDAPALESILRNPRRRWVMVT